MIMGWQPQELSQRENQGLDLTVLIPKGCSEARAGCVYHEKRKKCNEKCISAYDSVYPVS